MYRSGSHFFQGQPRPLNFPLLPFSHSLFTFIISSRVFCHFPQAFPLKNQPKNNTHQTIHILCNPMYSFTREKKRRELLDPIIYFPQYASVTSRRSNTALLNIYCCLPLSRMRLFHGKRRIWTWQCERMTINLSRSNTIVENNTESIDSCESSVTEGPSADGGPSTEVRRQAALR